jgi:hypothetical protein
MLVAVEAGVALVKVQQALVDWVVLVQQALAV